MGQIYIKFEGSNPQEPRKKLKIWMPTIMENLGDAVEKLHPAFDFPEEKHSGIGRDLAAVEIDLDLFSLDVFKKKPFGGMINFLK